MSLGGNEASPQAYDAGKLISYGLMPRLRPGNEPTYAELIKLYRTDSSYRSMVQSVASGLGLVVLEVTELGIVLSAQEESPFAIRAGDYRANMRVEERLCHGLIHVAIASWCFPTAASLEDPDASLVRLTTQDLVRYIVELCEEMARAIDEDAQHQQTELREAWRAVLERAETRETKDGRRSAGTLTGMVHHALSTLESGGLVRKLSDEAGGTWQTFTAFRVHVREAAAHKAFASVRAATERLQRRDEQATSVNTEAAD